jgi:NADH-quinone oxidoreductase subunit J
VHDYLLAATIPDAVTFVVAAAICVVGALGVVLSKNPVHSALMLIMTLFGVAVLFVEENAQFLAAVQVIVYAGAIVVLFLFVIMLLGVDRQEAINSDPLGHQRLWALLLGALTLAEVLLLAKGNWATGAHSLSGSLDQSRRANVYVLGKSVFTTYLLAFEVTSALLVIAIIGAVVLARRTRSRIGPAGGDLTPPFVDPPGPDDDTELAEENAPEGASPQPDLVLSEGRLVSAGEAAARPAEARGRRSAAAFGGEASASAARPPAEASRAAASMREDEDEMPAMPSAGEGVGVPPAEVSPPKATADALTGISQEAQR